MLPEVIAIIAVAEAAGAPGVDRSAAAVQASIRILIDRERPAAIL